jgi:Holliday junction resolvase
MSNPSKQKGTAFETGVKKALEAAGFDARRMPLSGAKDVGDLNVHIHSEKGAAYKIVLECKATKSIDLASAVTEANKECDNAEADFGFAVIKRRMKSINDAYVVMTLTDLEVLFTMLGWT